MSSRVLILFAHPALTKSRVHRPLRDAVHDLSGVTFHDLYDHYPDFVIDAKAEQERLVSHDVIVFQHPFYWYSVPALLREWQDRVLEHGFAFGDGGTALQGKITLSVLSTGGGPEAYAAGRADRFTVRQLLAPLEQTARLCGMTFLAPFIFFGPETATDDGLAACAARYRRLVIALRDGTLDIAAARAGEKLEAVPDPQPAEGAAA